MRYPTFITIEGIHPPVKSLGELNTKPEPVKVQADYSLPAIAEIERTIWQKLFRRAPKSVYVNRQILGAKLTK